MLGNKDNPRGERGIRRDQRENVFSSVTGRRKLSAGFTPRWPRSEKRFPSGLGKRLDAVEGAPQSVVLVQEVPALAAG